MQLIFDRLNDSFPLNGVGYSNALDSAHLPRHRWYFVKEAFSPHIVAKALEDAQCTKTDLVLDPFCGSGTVPLATSLCGYRAIGYEVNPFLAFISRTKLLQCDPPTLGLTARHVITQAKQGAKSPLETFSTFSQAGGAQKWLFNEAVLRAFEGGWNATSSIAEPFTDLLRLGLIGAAMDTCNATRDGKCLRYRRDWQSLRLGKDDFIHAFRRRIEHLRADMDASPNTSNLGTVLVGDARRLLQETVSDKFKLCVTSPPYLNSFDYSDVYRPELFLGKFVSSHDELRRLRTTTIRSHIQASWKLPTEQSFGQHYQDSVDAINAKANLLWNKRIPIMIQAYFEDMAQVLRDLRSRADPQASVWLVVSTSAYAGIEVPVDLIIADIGTKAGWFLREVGVLRYLRTSGQHWHKWSGKEHEKPRLRESVVIFDASPPRRKRQG